MSRFMTFFLASLFLQFAQAEFVGTDLAADENEAVIEGNYFEELTLEDPLFSSRKEERNLASLKKETSSSGPREWQGQLSVLKEIPYSYAWVSHATMQLRVLAELEEEESKKKASK